MDQLIIFNHNYAGALHRVLAYNRPFGTRLHIAAPFSLPGALKYSNGSYLWQGAIISYFKQATYDKLGYTLISHDDVCINPAIELDSRFDHPAFRDLFEVRGDLWDWHWNFRLVANWFTPKSVLFGSGVDDPVRLLKESLLYRANESAITALEASRLSIKSMDSRDYPDCVSGYLSTFFPEHNSLDFGLPLFCGNSDFLVLPNWLSTEIVDFLERTIQCGLFVEVALPTLFKWLQVRVELLGERLHFPFANQYDKFSHFTSLSDITDFFRENTAYIAIHPVKFSRLEA